MAEPSNVTIYADGGRNLEVLHVAADQRVPLARKICVAAESPDCEVFNLRRGDFLIVRLED